MKSRIIVLFAGFCILWASLVGRAVQIQILPDARLQSLKNRQFKTSVTVEARRGAILDRHGRDLALSAAALSLYADPKIIASPRKTAQKLARILKTRSDVIHSKIKDRQRRFVWIARRIDPEQAEKIKALRIRGLSFIEEWKRVYPNETVLGQTLGFLGVEGQGLEGIELHHDEHLRGNTRKFLVRRDARGRPLMADGLMFQQNPDGHDLQLTIDAEVQYMLESELTRVMKETEAESAVGVVMDAATSAIRAVAAVPGFDPNRARRFAPELRRNRALTDAFEPGSTMKTFVVATALNEGLIQPNSKFFCENGKMKVGGRTIREADSRHKWGWLSVSEILAFSSNIGTAKMAFDLKADRVRQGLELFGFGARSGVDLPGEARGTLHGLPWGDHLLSNVSFGHGMTATPLQIANAYAAIANGGVLRRPYIVESVIDGETGKIRPLRPTEPIRRVLAPEVASQMRLLLSGVTAPGGTGVNAKVPGFIVAGKTGTAQKVNPKGRGYLPGGYISSFAGFLPAHDPRLVIFVAVDHPKKVYYGSQVAAPLFSRIGAYAARREGLAPVLLTEKNLVKPKDSRESEVGEREEKLDDIMPDWTDLALRDVLRRIQGADVELKVIGRGMVKETIPAPGESLDDRKKITVILK